MKNKVNNCIAGQGYSVVWVFKVKGVTSKLSDRGFNHLQTATSEVDCHFDTLHPFIHKKQLFCHHYCREHLLCSLISTSLRFKFTGFV